MDLYSGASKKIILLGIIFPVVVLGRPQLNSSIGLLELSGEQCPGTLTLTCDAVNLGSDETIRWFVGDEPVAEFDAATDSTPFTGTTTRPDILNATVRLTSASLSNSSLSFRNFTLSTSVSNFLSLQGQSISCGYLGPVSRSSLFRIREFTLINESTSYQELSGSVRYRANFKGSVGTLKEVEIFWNNTMSVCREDITYSASIDYNDKRQTKTVRSQQCSIGLCSAVFYLTSNAITDITVLIYAGNHLISSATIANTTGNDVTINDCSEEVLIQCSSFTNVNCCINYEKSLLKQTVMIQPGFTHRLSSRDILEFEINISNESLILEQCINISPGSCSQPSSRTGLIVGVVIAVVVVVVVAIGLAVAVVVAKFIPYKKKHQEIGNHETPVEMILAKLNLDDLSVDEKGMVVDKQGKRIFEDNLTDVHRFVGGTGKDQRLLLSEETNAEARKALEEHNKLKEEKARKALEEHNKLEEEKARKALEECNKLEEEKEGAHVYDTTQFPNTTSAGQSEADEAVGEDYDRIKTNDDEYDHLRDQKKNTKPPKQDGNPVVYSDLNPTEKEDRDRLIDRNNTSITKPKHNKKRSEQHNTKNTFK